MARRKGSKAKSKAESMTGAKEGAVEVRTAAAEGAPELALPKPDDYEFHKKQIIGYQEKRETANSNYRNALKSAQKAGIDTEALLEANKLKRSNDHAKMQRHFSQLAFALRQEGYPIEISVTDTLKTDAAETAYQRGYTAGKAGETMGQPYPAGSDLAAQYTKGWHHGTGANLGQTPEQVDAALADTEGEGAGDGGRTWPDDEQLAAAHDHGTHPEPDENRWDDQAEKIAAGSDPLDLPPALDRRHQAAPVA